MSARGVKGAAVARGGTDGSDFKDRQVLAPRYEAMAGYRSQLVQLFSFLPYFYLISILLTALHFHSPQLRPITLGFMPPFYVQLAGLMITAAFNLASVKSQSSLPLMVCSALATVFVIYLTVLYAFQTLSPAKNEAIGFVWYLMGAVMNALIFLLNGFGIFNAYMITALQSSKKQ